MLSNVIFKKISCYFSFTQLYIEPINILNIPIGTEENPLQSPVPISETSHRQQSVSSVEGKINGRLTLTEIQTAQLASVAEEGSSISGDKSTCNVSHQYKKKQPQEIKRGVQDRRSDEKIIADILQPEERIRLSKSSDRSLKLSGTNTAISLDS